MDVIKNYLDNIFAAYPQTEEVLALRRDMLANMEEKYAALRNSGKSEHEAAYGVIADFGNMEEITAELGICAKTDDEDISLFLSQSDADTYLAKSKRYGLLIGFGVWLIIAGVSSVTAMGGSVNIGLPFIVDAGGVADIALLFPAIAIAVVMFMYASASMKKFVSYEEKTLRFDKTTLANIKESWEKFSPFYSAMNAGGVALIILAVGAMAVFEIPEFVFLNIIGLAVLMFIYASCYGSAFDALLGEGEYANKISNRQTGRLIGAIAAVYWPLVSALGVALLFLGVSNFWIVWPVGGILFGGICGGIVVWADMKGKK